MQNESESQEYAFNSIAGMEIRELNAAKEEAGKPDFQNV